MNSLLDRQLQCERETSAAIKAGQWARFWRTMARWHALQARIVMVHGKIGWVAGCLRQAAKARDCALALEKGAGK